MLIEDIKTGIQKFLGAPSAVTNVVTARIITPNDIENVKAAQTKIGMLPTGQIGLPLLSRMKEAGAIPASMPVHGVMLTAMCAEIIMTFEGLEQDNRNLHHSLGDDFPCYPVYICPAGYATVGWGHVVLDNAGHSIDVENYGLGALKVAREYVKKRFGNEEITYRQAQSLLSFDLEDRAHQVFQTLIPEDVTVSIPIASFQMDAITSLVFNIGICNFKSSSLLRMIKAPNRKVYEGDPRAMPFWATLKEISQTGNEPVDIDDAIMAWSRIHHVWTRGLARRRYVEVMRYHGYEDSPKAIADAFTLG